ncbi:sugar phosphate isomerase/epimerase family protein [Streptomyces sp. NPDC051018]|uniref:sugar phosphate isomerase/epimerase family protein n=1 Tax=Streptomyces sp. NPDC051018 TaxID=3365639 RepID=UPI0037A83CBD
MTTPPELSCCDTTFPLLGHRQTCELVRLLGFDAVDIALWGSRSHINAQEAASDPAGWSRRIEEHTASQGLTVADLFAIPHADYAVMAVNNPSADERARGRAWFRRIVELAALLGVDGITLVPGLDFPGEPHAGSLRRAAVELAVRADIAGAAGVRLSVEPHIGSVISSPDDTRELLDLAPGLEVTLDYSHFVMQGYAPGDLDPLLGRVRHVQARGARPDRLQVGMKENTIDFSRMLDALETAGYRGRIATEYLWIDEGRCDECDTLSETILLRDLLLGRTPA